MNHWLVCDYCICLYAETSLRRMRSLRCIKHGAILTDEASLAGLTRKAASVVVAGWRNREVQ